MDQPPQTLVSTLRGLRLETMTETERTDAMISVICDRFSSVEMAKTTLKHLQMGNALIRKLAKDDFNKRLEIIERRLHDLETHK
jgi:hypothetical protein